MAENRTARPVSGEIMTGPATNAALERAMSNAPDIVDADYVVLPRFATHPELSPRQPQIPPTPAIKGMGILRKPDASLPRPSRGGPTFWIAGVGIALVSFWVSGGHALVRQSTFWVNAAPASALTISGVTSRIDESGLKPVLFVDGEAANDGMGSETLPPLEIRVTDNDSNIIRYRLGTSDRVLAPGERFGFSSRLDVPRNGVRTVSVIFAG
ncbi:hypothetical protein [Mesorhizobium sp.]|jgi:hypothetical protein|uniref:hypothetical protein n=1 Tax=Mesorhizobium sp. TaxID=1871066 RepID=UPI000FE42883|nr:hypothetical protein [Mesorhizobium sp.]RWH67823.1 MAG: hypothetical protein EOQ84_28020 [Mesorhizobium sp.]RWL24608.1 MAG: hypothetical protein EOR58_22575 [Mesorhizobium sp.]RWL26660.1 MAG: hypothetical protein EOR63_24545 [Mesorhizobium sp.]RWL36201.1 MAG: hypothetical protein EOR59_21745 [Mesorhizobium sp.]RWL49400.1 MAG: hypothetical protein EOR61_24575 [Mesorhizobium sp.]